MLLLAHAALPDRIEAATVDHGLRAESADEAAMVSQLCSRLGVPHQTLTVKVEKGNLQSAARNARYTALANWMERRGLEALATAHHRDDQAETLLMRLNRGSGLAGLAGIREQTVVPGTGLALIRPVLGWSRAELAGVVKAAGVQPANDPTNRDESYDRVRLRQALAAADWIDASALARSAAHLAEADEALAHYAKCEWEVRVTTFDDGFLYDPGLTPPPVVKRVVGRIVEAMGGKPRGGQVADLHDALRRGEGGTLAGVEARCEATGWRFRLEPPRRS